MRNKSTVVGTDDDEVCDVYGENATMSAAAFFRSLEIRCCTDRH